MLGDLHATEAIQVLVGVLKDKTKNNGHNAVLNALLNIDDPSTADTIRAYYLDKTTDDGMKSVAINVLKATPTITWANPADIIYGTALSATQLNATTTVPGTFAYTPAAGAVLSAGAAQSATEAPAATRRFVA